MRRVVDDGVLFLVASAELQLRALCLLLFASLNLVGHLLFIQLVGDLSKALENIGGVGQIDLNELWQVSQHGALLLLFSVVGLCLFCLRKTLRQLGELAGQ